MNHGSEPGIDCLRCGVIAEAANDVIVEPWSAALRLLMRRAADRHQIADTAAIDTLAQVIP